MKVLVAGGSLLLGVAVAVAAVAVHQLWWGLLLGAGATVGALVLLPAGLATRPPYAAGFVALLAWVVGERPEGDYLVPADASGYLLLGLGLLVLVLAFATLPRRAAGGTLPPSGGSMGDPLT